ncbi:MAG: hypothetical protein AAF217_00470 [Pseudomonadota bacterium]
MKKLQITCVALISLAMTTFAMGAEFSDGSNAKEFGFIDEEKATFSGKVVDILCELSGDCAETCGSGNRLMGIVRDKDNTLVLVLKNAQLSFNGPVHDLVPYCNKKVDVDGLLIGDVESYNAKFYMVQFIRDAGAAEWKKAKLWTKAWKERNPEATGKGPWFRRDPRVIKQTEAEGYFGLGHEADEQYRVENQ